MMKTYCKTLALTAVISALSMPVLAQSVSGPGSQSMLASANPSVANEATQLVPAIAALSHPLDADKNHLNSTIKAELDHKVTLSDGTVLPSHTILNGEITRDDMQATGKSEFALRFNQAQLKDGKTVPIKATIFDIGHPRSDTDDDDTASDAASNDWTNQTLSVERLNVVSGVDLHSEIAGNDSAVFVSTRKHDVKLPAGSELKLAIGPASDASTPANSTPAN
jgi:uncharacterized lipoprotein YbaY